MSPEWSYQREVAISELGDLEKFAHSFAPLLLPGSSIGLSGTLGAGKTTLVRYLVAALGSETPVSSPTYALQHEYRVTPELIIEHWDLYRLNVATEELLERCPKQHLRLIEWPEKTPEIMADLDMLLTLSLRDGDVTSETRLLTVASKQPLSDWNKKIE